MTEREFKPGERRSEALVAEGRIGERPPVD
jgi:hypothetical protein